MNPKKKKNPKKKREKVYCNSESLVLVIPGLSCDGDEGAAI